MFALGILASIVLHVYFTSRWSYYARSIPDHVLAQSGGRAPEKPFVSETGRSLLHGVTALFVLGAAATSLSGQRNLGAGSSFSAGVGVGHVFLSLLLFGLGNMWPISYAFIFVVTAGPALVGASLVRFVHSRSILSKGSR